MNTCAAETRRMGDYLSDNLGASQRQGFESHLKACPECAAFLATYKKTIALTRCFLIKSNNQLPRKLLMRAVCADRH